eukprot:357286-Chlamydomonas_euryale.AAC.9
MLARSSRCYCVHAEPLAGLSVPWVSASALCTWQTLRSGKSGVVVHDCLQPPVVAGDARMLMGALCLLRGRSVRKVPTAGAGSEEVRNVRTAGAGGEGVRNVRTAGSGSEEVRNVRTAGAGSEEVRNMRTAGAESDQVRNVRTAGAERQTSKLACSRHRDVPTASGGRAGRRQGRQQRGGDGSEPWRVCR